MSNEIRIAVGAPQLELPIVGRQPRVEHFCNGDAMATTSLQRVERTGTSNAVERVRALGRSFAMTAAAAVFVATVASFHAALALKKESSAVCRALLSYCLLLVSTSAYTSITGLRPRAVHH